MNLKLQRGQLWPLVTLLFFLKLFAGYSQNLNTQFQIHGQVTIADGIPLPGVTVKVKGRSDGTTTDFDGKYTIVVSRSEVLIFSSIGFETQELVVKDQAEINIKLKEDTQALEEVVVIGYGTQKKKDLTGSVSSVAQNLIKERPLNSVEQALQGSVPGVQVTQTSGQPGGGISVRIRGGGSIQGGNEPLYVIDGFPVYNNPLSAGVTTGAQNNPLAAINPSDIESIDILKDASATAIYGSRGANGVVIIKTKSGIEGKTKITYTTSYGFQELNKKIGVMNAPQFARLRNEALLDRNPAGGAFQYLSENEISALGTGTDWQDAAFREAPLLEHDVSIQGGAEKVRYVFSTSYFDQKGILDNTGFTRLSSRINLHTSLSDNFDLGINLTGSKTTNDIAPNGVVSALLTMPPTASIFDSEGNYTLRNPFENVISNPIASLNLQTNKNQSYRLLGTIYGEYTFLKKIKLKVSFGTDMNQVKEKFYLPTSLYEGSLVGGEARLGSIQTESWLNENTLVYNESIGDHNFEGLLGFTQQEFTSESFSAGSQNFVTDNLTFNNLAGGSQTLVSNSNIFKWSLLSYLGRFNYNYKGAYFLTATFRADGSSKFGQNNKWGYFPSVALAWRISSEPFFERYEKVINNLKLRGTYGVTGNQEIGVYQSLATLSPVRLLLGDSFSTGFTPDRIANSDLSWETTKQANIGIDVGLFNSKVDLTVDAYYKKTENLLLNVEIPWTSGFSNSLQNYGSVENKGIELGLRTTNFSGAFDWNSNFNISFNRNKVLSIGEGDTDFILGGNFNGDFIIKEGQPLGSFYGAVSNGILQQSDNEAREALTGRSNPQPGDRVYEDIDGDGVFTTAGDRRIIGNAQPDFIFGFSNSFQCKNFDLNVLFQGSVGNDILNGNRQILELLTGQQNASIEAVNRWTPTNTSSTVPRASGDPSNIFVNRFVEDGSYLRLKNVVLGYNLPSSVTSILNLEKLRFYISAQNLITWTDYSGYDPEVTSSENTLTQGYDAGVYPTSRTISGGLVINL